MGKPMAGHLLAAGHQVTVWNRTAGRGESLRAQGATFAVELAEVGPSADVIMLCVRGTEDVEECLAELYSTAAPGTLFVDHSTISPEGAVKIGEATRNRGFRFIDAPVTGGSMGAEKGTLTIFVGATDADAEEAIPLLAAYGRRVAHVGPVGAGQMMKMANQIAVGGAVLALCESLNFAAKAGLDLAVTKELLGTGGGGSWAFENYGPKILNHDWTPGFSAANQRKDFGYCREAAEKIGAALPGTLVIDRLLAELEADGRGQDTTAAVFEVLRDLPQDWFPAA